MPPLTEAHRDALHDAPRAVPSDTDCEPLLHRRATDEFRQLLRFEQEDCVLTRLTSHFLGSDGSIRSFMIFGKLRVALLWGALGPFLDRQHWRVTGAIGFEDGRAGSEVVPPEFESLRLDPSLWLEIPKNLQLFLESCSAPGERAVVRFHVDQFDNHLIGIAAPRHERRPRLLEDWLDFTRRNNALRGRKLLADGRLAPVRTNPEDGRLFLPELLRDRLDFAVRRFTSPVAQRLGLRRRAGLILAGPPGTGKSSIGRELAESLECTFLWVTPGDLNRPEQVHEVFEIARWLAPTVIFLEDLDLIAESRDRGFRGNLLGPLMNELDGAAGDQPILTIATTNRLEVVEEAVRNRPGRFDQVLEVGPPDEATRRHLLAHRLRTVAIAPADLGWVVEQLEGSTGAQIEEVANGAIAAAALDREDRPGERIELERSHLLRALDLIGRAPERRTAGFAAVEEERVVQ